MAPFCFSKKGNCFLPDEGSANRRLGRTDGLATLFFQFREGFRPIGSRGLAMLDRLW
jgi:hypothetical protein